MRLQIRVSCKDGKGTRKFELFENDHVVFGRANPDLKTDDQRLSRRHFEVALRNSCIEITHLSKTNPTLMATDSEPAFKPVDSKRSAKKFCRVIAGSHKFLIEMEGADIELGPPGPTLSITDPGDPNHDVSASESVPTTIGSQRARSNPLNEEELDSWIIEPLIEYEESSLVEEASVDFQVPEVPHEEKAEEPGFPERATSISNVADLESMANAHQPKTPIEKIDFSDSEGEPPAASEEAVDATELAEHPAEPAAEKEPPRTETPGTTDKMTFPIDDDFFD